MKCPLCWSDQTKIFSDETEVYHRCSDCDLIFIDPHYYLNQKEERNFYRTHENSIENEGYIIFLNRLMAPFEKELHLGQVGLDYGCGPGPTLSILFERKGYLMDIYDPFFFPNEEIFTKEYDFISMTEVIEHLHHPRKDLKRIINLLKKDGYLGLMTKLFNDNIDFNNWYYRKDPTHVIFFTKQTFNWIERYFSLDLIFEDHDNVFIFKKNKLYKFFTSLVNLPR